MSYNIESLAISFWLYIKTEMYLIVCALLRSSSIKYACLQSGVRTI